MTRVQALRADSIPLRLCRPIEGDAPLPVLVYVHGGGQVIGDLDAHETLCRRRANPSGCVMAMVDYRLAPGHPFSAAWTIASQPLTEFTAMPRNWALTPLAVGGESAGGDLAAGGALVARRWRSAARLSIGHLSGDR